MATPPASLSPCGYDPSAPKMAYRIRSRERSGVIGAAAEGWEHMYVLA
ncbi:Uncharacterised protein [Mycobacteroides abscessus subsp. abscessus]|nr:Uncharacterised protein [Mycobacteroides abscessus subsp. abscessus]